MNAVSLPREVIAQQWTVSFNHNFGTGSLPQPIAGLGTDPTIPFGPNANLRTTPVSAIPNPPIPTRFDADHASLIPKGPYRGMVLVWNSKPVFGEPIQDQNHTWSFQSWSIVDLNPNLGPYEIRFRNFLLPIERINTGPGPGQFSGGNLFCAGHTWNSDGNLVVVGGTVWDPNGQQSAAKTTFIFDPAAPSAPFPPPISSTTPLYHITPGFPEFGMWLRGPDLVSGRYYPTAVLTHKLARTGGKPIVLVLGGDANLAAGNPAANSNVGQNPTWNNFEALVISFEPVHPQISNAGSGLVRDSFTINGGPISLYPGPGQLGGIAPQDDWLWFYPRAHLLTTGHVMVSGFAAQSRVIDPEFPTSSTGTTNWIPTQPALGFLPSSAWQDMRTYGATVRFPNVFGDDNILLRLGGGGLLANQTSIPVITNTVEFCLPATFLVGALPAWQVPMAGSVPLHMNFARATLNVVLLPDSAIMAIGGADVGVDHLTSEILKPGDSAWSGLPAALSPRTYHSTGLLQPTGWVMAASGETKTCDYELFEPAYIGSPDAPQGVGLSDANGPLPNEPLTRGDTFILDCEILPFGVSLQRVVLMAPGSTTHHSDMSQRYHQLEVTSQGQANQFKFITPISDKALPGGHYMLFAVTNSGVPSVATWVRLP